MTIKDYSAKHGARMTAKKLIDNRVKMLAGLGIDDLPDTAQLCCLIDDLEQVILSDPSNSEGIKEILKNIDIDLIESTIFD